MLFLPILDVVDSPNETDSQTVTKRRKRPSLLSVATVLLLVWFVLLFVPTPDIIFLPSGLFFGFAVVFFIVALALRVSNRTTGSTAKRSSGRIFLLITCVAALITLEATSKISGGFFDELGVLSIWFVLAIFWSTVVSRATLKSLRSNTPSSLSIYWLLVPFVVVVTLGLCLSGAPRNARFALSRSALEQEIKKPIGKNNYRNVNDWVGLYEIHEVRRIEGGIVLATGYDFFSTVGFAYLPSGPPEKVGQATYDHLSGPWYAWNDGVD